MLLPTKVWFRRENRKMRQRINWNWFAIVWASVILILSLLPGEDLPEINFWEIDKLVHALFYAVLCFSTVAAFITQYNFGGNRLYSIFFAISLCILFGLCIEVVQGTFLESRFFDIYDLVANFIGCLLGVIGIIVIFKPH
ncbi:MAG: VanZ family protein [Bacteroidia bacterium]